MKVARVEEPAAAPVEPEQKNAVVVTLYANEKIPVYARLDEFPPPPPVWWCIVFLWRMTLAALAISLPVVILIVLLRIIGGR